MILYHYILRDSPLGTVRSGSHRGLSRVIPTRIGTAFKKIELCIFSTVLFTAISAGLYTWSIEFLSYIGKSHNIHALAFYWPFHALLQPAVLL